MFADECWRLRGSWSNVLDGGGAVTSLSFMPQMGQCSGTADSFFKLAILLACGGGAAGATGSSGIAVLVAAARDDGAARGDAAAGGGAEMRLLLDERMVAFG